MKQKKVNRSEIIVSEEKLMKIADLSPNIREVNLIAKVVELGEEREVFNRNTQENHKVMDVLLGDETGTVYFSAWNEQIEKLKEDETYHFSDSKTILFRGHIRLSLGRNGSLTESEEKIEEVNTENNISSEEHEYRRRSYYNRSRGYDNRR